MKSTSLATAVLYCTEQPAWGRATAPLEIVSDATYHVGRVSLLVEMIGQGFELCGQVNVSAREQE